MSFDHPFTGSSGVSVYCRDLFPALVDRGVAVGAICIQHRDWRLRPYVRTTQERGVTVFSLVNSPLDSDLSVLRPIQDCRQPAMERLVRSCLDEFRPDLLHVQTFHGYPASIVTVARQSGVPCIVTLHDFWTICPRVVLVRVQGDPCDGPNGGVNCALHCARPVPWRRRAYRLGTRLPDGALRRGFFSLHAAYRRLTGRQTSMWDRPPGPAQIDPSVIAQYRERNDNLVRVVAQADRLIAVSEFTKSVLVRHGFEPDRIHIVPPTLAISEHIVRRQRPTPVPPVRFGYLGRVTFLKGGHVFALAARGIPIDRARFLMFGPASPETQRYLHGLAGDGRLDFRGAYTRRDLQAVLDQTDVAVVPSIAQETVGLVTLEAQAAGLPVIGARIGAIPEYVRDGENGLLFRAGDADDLRDRMMRVIEQPSLLAAMSARTRAPLSMRDHVDVLLQIYEEAAMKGGRAPWTDRSVASSPPVGGAAG